MNTEDDSQAVLSGKKNTSSKSPMHLLLAFVILFLLAATAVYVNHIKSSPDANTKPTPVATSPNFSLSPAQQTLKVGEKLTVSVWEDSGSTAVNAVQTSLTYSPDQFEVTDIDASASPFDVEAPTTNTPGSLILARGNQGNLTGKQLVAKVTFTAKSETKTARISFEGKNVLVTSNDNKDILKDTTGGTYTIGAAQ